MQAEYSGEHRLSYRIKPGSSVRTNKPASFVVDSRGHINTITSLDSEVVLVPLIAGLVRNTIFLIRFMASKENFHVKSNCHQPSSLSTVVSHNKWVYALLALCLLIHYDSI